MMPAPVALLVIVFAACAPGALALRLWRKRFAADPVEFLFTALTFGLLLIGWSALLLAGLGRFSLPALAGIWLAVVLALAAAAVARRARPAPVHGGPSNWNAWEAAALAVWLAVAAFVYFRPHEFIIGGADAGVYVNLGANISRTGGILIRDPLLGALDEPLRSAFLRAMPPGEAAPYYLLPGLYVTGSPPDLITPQFFHLHPAWQAVGFALGGLNAELLIAPLWGLLGCLAIYMIARSLWGWRPALLALVALSATALQVWFARYPTAEVLTQYLFWSGGWALGRWLARDEPPGLWACVAGLALGQVFLARADTYALLALPVILVAWFTLRRGWRRDALWFFAPFLLLAAHTLAHGLLITRPYFILSVGAIARPILRLAGQRSAVALLGAALIALAIGAAVGLWRAPALRDRVAAQLAARWPAVLRLAAILVILLALFAYFIRPQLGELRVSNYWFGGGDVPVLDRENFVRLGWYLTPLGLALGVGGIALLIARDLNRRTAFWLLAGGFFTAVFLWKIGANPHQIYVMRRYVPQALPLFILGAVYFVRWLWSRRPPVGRGLALLLTGGWIAGIVLVSLPFAAQVDYRGLAAQVDDLNAALPSKAVVLFDDPAPVGVADFLGTPLRLLYGRPVFPLRQEGVDAAALSHAIARWRRDGYEVVLLQTDAAQLWPLGEAALGPAQTRVLRFAQLENTYDSPPRNILSGEWQVRVRAVKTTEGSQ